MCVYTCAHEHVCMYVEARGQPQCCCSGTIHLVETRSLTGFWGLPIPLGWMASELQGSVCLHLPCFGITSLYHHTCLFICILEIELRSSPLHNHFPGRLNHCPGSTDCLFSGGLKALEGSSSTLCILCLYPTYGLFIN